MKNVMKYTRSVKRSAVSAVAVALLTIAWQSNAQWVAYHDVLPGPGTGANVTTFGVDGANGIEGTGFLQNILTGTPLPVSMTISNTGPVNDAGTMSTPNAGTPAYNMFNGYVDFNTASGGQNAVYMNAAGEMFFLAFTGLNPSSRYTFKGSAVRGNYDNRWTLVTIIDANTYTAAHELGAGSPGFIDTAYNAALGPNQVAFNAGRNNVGDVVGWQDIDPGPDGMIIIRCEIYNGAYPPGGAASNGSTSYGLNAIRLEEVSSIPTAISITDTNLPASLEINEGETATFNVLVSGSTPSFQWYKDNAALAGENGAQLTIPNATPANNGSYLVVVSNNINAVTSRVALLDVAADTVPPFLVSAEGRGIPSAVFVTFSEAVDAATATNVSNYSLTPETGGAAVPITGASVESATVVRLDLGTSRLFGVNYLLNASGVRDVAYTPNTLIPDQVVVPGDTQVTIFTYDNTWSYDNSNTDRGTTWKDPGYDASAWLTGQGLLGYETGTGYSEPFRTTFTGYTSATTCYYYITTFEFTNDLAGVILTVNHYTDDGGVFYLNGQIIGSIRFDTNVIWNHTTGATGTIGTEGTLESFTVPAGVLVQGANVLAVEVHQSGTGSSDTVFGMELIAEFPPPPTPLSIATQPASTNLFEGQTLNLSVGVAGSGALYQWYFNNAPVANETSDTLTVANAMAINSGNYFVVASNSVNAVTSAVAAVTVVPDNVRPTVAHAELLDDGVTALVRFSEPVNQAQAENLANYTISGLSLFSAILTNGTDLLITHNPRLVVQNHTLTIGGIADLAPTPNTMNSTSLLMQVGFAIFGGITVPWYYNTSGQDLGTNWYQVVYPDEQTWPQGEQIFYAGEDPVTKEWPFSGNQLTLNVTSTYFRVTFSYPYDPAGATLRLQLAVDDGCVIYLNGHEAARFSMPAGPVDANTFANSHEAPDGGPEAGQGPGGTASEWDVVELDTTHLVQGNNVLAVSVHQTSAGSSDVVFGAQLKATTWPIGLPVPARLTQQPQSVTTNQGANVTFTAAAAGTAPLQYQWYFNGSNMLSGQTTATLTLNNVQAADEGDYTLVVRNNAGSVTSQVATLTVLRMPVITTQPQAATVAVGETVTFSVVAEGSMPMTYQWYFDNVAYPGKTNDTLELNNVQPANAADYHVVVANAAGSVTSAVVRLTVSGGQATQPEIAPPGIVGSQIGFTFASENGYTYTLQFTPTLNPIDWQDVPGQSVGGDGTVKSLSDSNTSQTERYYRLKVD